MVHLLHAAQRIARARAGGLLLAARRIAVGIDVVADRVEGASSAVGVDPA